MTTAIASTKHLPRSAGRVGFAHAVSVAGECRLESSLANWLSLPRPEHGCGYQDRQGSPGEEDV